MGLEAEAEGREPGESLEEESERLEGAIQTTASSITEADSQDSESFLRLHPGLTFFGRAQPCTSSTPSLGPTRSKRVLEEDSQSQRSGLSESDLIFSPPTPDPLKAFLDMLERESSMLRDSEQEEGFDN